MLVQRKKTTVSRIVEDSQGKLTLTLPQSDRVPVEGLSTALDMQPRAGIWNVERYLVRSSRSQAIVPTAIVLVEIEQEGKRDSCRYLERTVAKGEART